MLERTELNAEWQPLKRQATLRQVAAAANAQLPQQPQQPSCYVGLLAGISVPACVPNVSFGCDPALPGHMWVNHPCQGHFWLLHGKGPLQNVSCGALMWNRKLLQYRTVCPQLARSVMDGCNAAHRPKVALLLHGAFSPPHGKFDASLEGFAQQKRRKPRTLGVTYQPFSQRERRTFANITGHSIRKHIIHVNRADVFIFSWTPLLRDLYEELYSPVAARYENNSHYRPMFEAICRRPNRSSCRWTSVSWAYSMKHGMQLVEQHEDRTGHKYDLVIFYRPDALLVRDLDACATVMSSKVIDAHAVLFHTCTCHNLCIILPAASHTQNRLSTVMDAAGGLSQCLVLPRTDRGQPMRRHPFRNGTAACDGLR